MEMNDMPNIFNCVSPFFNRCRIGRARVYNAEDLNKLASLETAILDELDKLPPAIELIHQNLEQQDSATRLHTYEQIDEFVGFLGEFIDYTNCVVEQREVSQTWEADILESLYGKFEGIFGGMQEVFNDLATNVWLPEAKDRMTMVARVLDDLQALMENIPVSPNKERRLA